jgi:lipopolysaccharide heptosyltransferase II
MIERARTAKLAGPIRRILVETKYRFIGDTLLAVPLLRAIARTWPEASISLVTGAKACELLKHCPYVHEFIEFDPYRACDKGLSSYFGLVSRLRDHRFDLAIVCNRSFHSALTACLGKARMRVGWSGFEKRDCLLTHTTPYDPNASEVESYLDLLRCVSTVTQADPRVTLWVTRQERESVRGRLAGSPIIAIQPGASHAEKQWPADRFAELAMRLRLENPGASFVLVGGPDERSATDSMARACDDRLRESLIDLVGVLPLRETLAVLTYVDLFVGGDTAIRHAAMALGKSSVALFGPTSARKWGNAAPPVHAVLAAEDGRVDSLTVDQVCGAASAALGTASSAASNIHDEIGVTA